MYAIYIYTRLHHAVNLEPHLPWEYFLSQRRRIKKLHLWFQNSERGGRFKAMARRDTNSRSRNGRQRRTTQHILAG